MVKKTIVIIIICSLMSCISFDSDLCYDYKKFYIRKYEDIVVEKIINYKMHSFKYLVLKNKEKSDTIYFNHIFWNDINIGDSLIKKSYSDTLLLKKKFGQAILYKMSWGCPKEKRIKIIEKIKREKMQK